MTATIPPNAHFLLIVDLLVGKSWTVAEGSAWNRGRHGSLRKRTARDQP
jgi:hypothetical protein